MASEKKDFVFFSSVLFMNFHIFFFLFIIFHLRCLANAWTWSSGDFYYSKIICPMPENVWAQLIHLMHVELFFHIFLIDRCNKGLAVIEAQFQWI